jgi:hypothetical protein
MVQAEDPTKYPKKGLGERRNGVGIAEIENVCVTPANVVLSHKDKKDVESPAAQIVRGTVKWEYIYAILGLVLGFACIIGGLVLCLHGIAGHVSWTASLLGLSSKINDAPPGVVLFIVGIFIIMATRPKIRLKNIR